MKLNETTDDSTPNKLKPISVLIHWSELSQLQSNEKYSFTDFEDKALSVALMNPLGGYDKTEVSVIFEGGHEHRCRLDLGCNDNDLGFSEHCVSVYTHYQKNHDNPDMPWMRESHQLELIGLIKRYSLDLVQVQHVRAKANQATEQAKQTQEEERRQKVKQREEALKAHKEKERVFKENLIIPEWAKAVIIATYTVYGHEESEPYNGEHYTITEKCIILAWSKHAQQRFPEMRKACLNYPDTAFLHDKAQSKEHRENYSLGAGNYLTDSNYRCHGWEVRKVKFWNEDEKRKYVPMGEFSELTRN